MNHVSVSPTDGNGPTQGQRKTPTRVGQLLNRPFAVGGHMVQKVPYWRASCALGHLTENNET